MRKILATTSILAILAIPLGITATVNTHSLDVELSSAQKATGSDYGDMASNFTICAWIQPESTPAAIAYIASKWNQSNQTVASWRFRQDSTNKITMDVYDASGNNETATNNTAITNGVFTHVCYTYDSAASPTSNFYINGSNNNGTNAISGALRDTTTNFEVGSEVSNSDADRYYDGIIDDLRMWSRTLTSGEVSGLYTDECTFANGASLTGWWEFDNDYTDSSGNGRTLTAVNTPTFTTTHAYDCVAAAAPKVPDLIIM